jgi:hypothetical protein
VAQKLAALVLTTVAGILPMDSVAVRRCVTFHSPPPALLKLCHKLGNIMPPIPFLLMPHERHIRPARASRTATFTSSYNNYGFSASNRAATDEATI